MLVQVVYTLKIKSQELRNVAILVEKFLFQLKKKFQDFKLQDYKLMSKDVT